MGSVKGVVREKDDAYFIDWKKVCVWRKITGGYLVSDYMMYGYDEDWYEMEEREYVSDSIYFVKDGKLLPEEPIEWYSKKLRDLKSDIEILEKERYMIEEGCREWKREMKRIKENVINAWWPGAEDFYKLLVGKIKYYIINGELHEEILKWYRSKVFEMHIDSQKLKVVWDWYAWKQNVFFFEDKESALKWMKRMLLGNIESDINRKWTSNIDLKYIQGKLDKYGLWEIPKELMDKYREKMGESAEKEAKACEMKAKEYAEKAKIMRWE